MQAFSGRVSSTRLTGGRYSVNVSIFTNKEVIEILLSKALLETYMCSYSSYFDPLCKSMALNRCLRQLSCLLQCGQDTG